jgi:hypothetical protein
MSLSYDFDMFSVIPQAFFDDAKLGSDLRRAGLSHDQRQNRVALFREPETASALARAPADIRAYLRKAGFGTKTYSSGASPGRFPSRDEPARLQVLRALRDNAAEFALPSPGGLRPPPGEFDLHTFLLAAIDARPMDMPSIRPHLISSVRQDPERVTLSAVGVVALSVAVACFLAIPLL